MRTIDNRLVGKVHRVVVDLEQQAIVNVVVLGRGPLARDALVPLDFIQSVTSAELLLRLTSDELDQLPDSTYKNFVTPPPETWTSLVPAPDGPMLIPVNQRKPLGQSQHEITPGTRVCAEDGIIGAVERAEVLDKGRLVAVWVHANGAFARDVRIPSEWIRRTDVNGNLLVAGARAKNRSVPWLMNAATRVRPLSRRHNCDWSRQQRG